VDGVSSELAASCGSSKDVFRRAVAAAATEKAAAERSAASVARMALCRRACTCSRSSAGYSGGSCEAVGAEWGLEPKSRVST
jgi:hypothetical protein